MTKAAAIAALFKAAQAIPHLLSPDETVEQWNDRVRMTVEQNYEAAGKYADGRGWTRFELALAVTVLEGNESGGFDRRVHAGEKHPRWTQDDGLARCLGQHHSSRILPKEKWEQLAGLDLDATARCAAATTMVLVSHARECGTFLGQHASARGVAAAYSAYATGGSCSPSDELLRRAKQWERLMVKFGPKPDVPGFRRATPKEIPDVVRARARELVASLRPGDGPDGTRDVVVASETGAPRWLLRPEKHAEGKIGVSVFVEQK